MTEVRGHRYGSDTPKENAALTDVLIHATAFWGMLLGSVTDSSLGCSLLLRLYESWHALLLEQDSIGKFIVSIST